MRITLHALTKKELDLILLILNLETQNASGTQKFVVIEEMACNYSTRAYGKYLAKGSRVWRAEDIPLRVLRNEWHLAQTIFSSAIIKNRDKNGLFCQLPAIGLPVQNPPVLIHGPDDLANWLVARAVANGQHRLFVKCARRECGKWGRRMRARATSKYHSKECQMIENARRAANRAAKPKSIEPLGRI